MRPQIPPTHATEFSPVTDAGTVEKDGMTRGPASDVKDAIIASGTLGNVARLVRQS